MEMKTASCSSGMSAGQRPRWPVLPTLATPTSRSTVHISVSIDRDAHHRHPSFLSDADVGTFQELNILRRGRVPVRDQHHRLGGVGYVVDVAYWLVPEEGVS